MKVWLVSNSREAKVFIDRPPGWGYLFVCPGDYRQIWNNPDSIRKYTKAYLPVEGYRDDRDSLVVFAASPVVCMDCTLRGSSLRPSYWPQLAD